MLNVFSLVLSPIDWTTFNNKFTLPSLTSGSLVFSNGTTLAQGNANLFFDNTSKRLGIGTATPAFPLHVAGAAYSSGSAAEISFADRASNTLRFSWYATGSKAYLWQSGSNANLLSVDTDGKLALKNEAGVDEFSADGTLDGNSDAAVPTEKAVKTYVDAGVASAQTWLRTGGDVYRQAGGRVGIGTSSPGTALDVRAGGGVTAAALDQSQTHS